MKGHWTVQLRWEGATLRLGSWLDKLAEMEWPVVDKQPSKGGSVMAEKAWMKSLDVQGWAGLRCSAQELKEMCQLTGMNSLLSHWENPVNVG